MTLDLTTFTEIDNESCLTETASTVSFVMPQVATINLLYKDYGASYFNGDCWLEGELNISAIAGTAVKVIFAGAFADALDGFNAVANEVAFRVQPTTGTSHVIYLGVRQNSAATNTATTPTGLITQGTTYYYRIGLTRSLSALGLAVLQLYSDAGRTTLVESIVYHRTFDASFRYLLPIQNTTNSASAGDTTTGTNANISLYTPAAGLDLTGFTEVDPNSRLAQVADCSTVTTLNTNETAYLYKDYGAGVISDYYKIKAAFCITAFVSGSGGMLSLLSLVNTLGHSNNTNDHHGIAVSYISATTFALYAREVSGTTEYLSSASSTLSTSQPYWIQTERTATGTYGTLEVKIFSDPQYTIQVGSTLSLTLHDNGTPDKVAFRYLNLIQSYNTGSDRSTTLTVGGLEVILPTTGTITETFADMTGEITAVETNESTISETFADMTGAVTAFHGNRATISETFADMSGAITVVETNKAQISETFADMTGAITANLNVPTAQISETFADMSGAITAVETNESTISETFADMTGAVTIAVPTTGTISDTFADMTGAVTAASSAVTEKFSVRLRHKTTGANITGVTTLYLIISKPSTGERFDFDDNTWQTTPVTATLVLSEVSSANQPGLYRSEVTTTTWNGWIEFEAYYNDGSFTYSFSGEAYYTNGKRSEEHVESILDDIDAEVDSIETDLAKVPRKSFFMAGLWRK